MGGIYLRFTADAYAEVTLGEHQEEYLPFIEPLIQYRHPFVVDDREDIHTIFKSFYDDIFHNVSSYRTALIISGYLHPLSRFVPDYVQADAVTTGDRFFKEEFDLWIQALDKLLFHCDMSLAHINSIHGVGASRD